MREKTAANKTMEKGFWPKKENMVYVSFVLLQGASVFSGANVREIIRF
jgi:hypothetical protein